MLYRELGKTGFHVSAIGLGGEHLCTRDQKTIDAVIGRMVEAGVNIVDLFMPEEDYRDKMGKGLAPYRQKMFLQGHIGSVLQNGQSSRSRDIKTAEYYVRDFLKRYHTDYIDLGMVFFIDTEKDYQEVFETGFIDYCLKLKKEGVVRKLGFSSHMASTAYRALQHGVFDSMMFAINPAYDMIPTGTPLNDMIGGAIAGQLDPERRKLYEYCEANGIGITVMKSLGAGKLMDPAQTPFSVPLSVTQCIHYALSKPAVASALVGVQTVPELEEALRYLDASEEERDFSVIAGDLKESFRGNCMYCNHCLPCPKNIDVASVHKYLDLATVSGGQMPPSVREHYNALEHTGSDCIACGSCERACPFAVPVIANMKRAAEVFGR